MTARSIVLLMHKCMSNCYLLIFAKLIFFGNEIKKQDQDAVTSSRTQEAFCLILSIFSKPESEMLRFKSSLPFDTSFALRKYNS